MLRTGKGSLAILVFFSKERDVQSTANANQDLDGRILLSHLNFIDKWLGNAGCFRQLRLVHATFDPLFANDLPILFHIHITKVSITCFCRMNRSL